MASITVRVPATLRKKMRRVRGVNWSQVIRAAVEERVRHEARLRRSKSQAAILEAMQTQDRIATVLGRTRAPGWRSVEVIRYWRDHRYSSSTPP
jgi:hypothetical protein